MLYKHPGVHEIHGDKFDYIIVDADDAAALSDALEAGWFFTTTEAKAAKIAPVEPTPSAQFIENLDAPRRGRPRKVTEVEPIPDSL
jgi:hypothetical protein